MKILLILNNFTKHLGIEKYALELAKYYTKEHKVHLLTSISDLSLNEYYNIPNLVIYKKKTSIRKPYWLQLLINAYLNTKHTKDLKNKLKIDVVHSGNSWESRSCDIVTIHSCYRAWLKTANEALRKESFYLKYLLYKIRRWLLPKNRVQLSVEKDVLERGSKKIIVASEVLKRDILENYNVPEEKIVVIPFGVNLDEFKPDLKKRLEIRKKHNIDENDIVLILSGYEFKRKGLKYIIEALPLVKGNVKILAVGEESPKRYEELAISLGVLDKIIFTGFAPEIKDYYAASDIYILPTTYEPFGIVVLEAMASGLPVIISKLAGSAEIIKNGYEGLLLDNPTNSKEIAEKMNLLISNKDLRKQMGENAYKTAQKYSWEETARKTLKVYQEILTTKN